MFFRFIFKLVSCNTFDSDIVQAHTHILNLFEHFCYLQTKYEIQIIDSVVMVRFSGWQQKFGFVFVTISFNCFVFDFMKWKTTKISIKLFYCILFFSNFDCNLFFFHLFRFCFICRLFENLVIGRLSLWLIFFSQSFIHSWLIRLTPCVKAKAYWSFFSLNDIVLECLKKICSLIEFTILFFEISFWLYFWIIIDYLFTIFDK